MLKMNPYVTDPKDDPCCKEKRIPPVNRHQQDSKNRQRGAGDRDSQQTAVEVPHRFFTAEIPDPVQLLQDHQQECAGQP